MQSSKTVAVFFFFEQSVLKECVPGGVDSECFYGPRMDKHSGVIFARRIGETATISVQENRVI